MDYQEKLRLAKKALDSGSYDKETIEYIFPELKESEDERIRKEILEYFQQFDNKELRGVNISDWISWLEKQGEKIDTIENFNTEFEKQVSHLIASAINKEHEYNQSYVKWTANALLNYAKHELEKQDEHKCDCKYVGCHVNNMKRWCHKKQSEVPYEKCNTECSEYLKQGNISPTKDELEALRIAAYEPVKNWSEKLQSLYEKLVHREQKSTNKVEPKFKAGDFITDGKRIFQIEETVWERNNRNDGSTYCESLIVNLRDGITYANNTDLKEYHLWTIQDAKDGDIIFSKDNHGTDSIELIKSISDNRIKFWFCLSSKNNFKDCYYEISNGDIPYTNFSSRKKATPTTKEQRDLLFQKMKEAGYEWDADKKELKKIEQKPTWSEEDENIYARIIRRYTDYEGLIIRTKEESIANKVLSAMTQEEIWLKSLKERVWSQSN